MLRDRCKACPWLDLATLEVEDPDIVAHARTNPHGFVCHTRLGPCDGPVVAMKRSKVTAGEVTQRGEEVVEM